MPTAVPKTIRTALEHVLEYLWTDEERDFESYRDDDTNEMSAEANDHVFRSLQIIADWLDQLDDDDDGNTPTPPTADQSQEKEFAA